MRIKGIYPNNFLDKYLKRSKNFECFNCHLVSPKNYFIECQHCICQNCLKKKKFCSLCKTQLININGENHTAFQFKVSQIILYPYLMKCIFDSCPWTGTYEDFIKKHYDICQYRKGKKLLNEYFEEFDEEIPIENNKRSKSELKVVRRSSSFYEEKYKSKYTYNKTHKKISETLTYKLTEENSEDNTAEFNIGENNFNNGTEFIELNDSEEILEQTTISVFESKEEKFIPIPEEYNKEYEKDSVIKDNVVILLDDVNGIDENDNKSNNSNKNNFENQNEMSENKGNDNSESSSNESGSVTEIVYINDSENTNSNNNNSEKDEEKEERENKEEQYDFNFLNRKRKFYGYDEDDDYNFFE